MRVDRYSTNPAKLESLANRIDITLRVLYPAAFGVFNVIFWQILVDPQQVNYSDYDGIA